MSSQRLLLAALLVVTGMVIIRSVSSQNHRSHSHSDDIISIEIDGVDVDVHEHINEDIERTVEQAMQAAEHALENLHESMPEFEERIEHLSHEKVRERSRRLLERVHRNSSERGSTPLIHSSKGDEVMVERSFEVDNGGELVVDLPGADVEIMHAEGSKAEVRLVIKDRSQKAARERLEKLDLEIRGDSDGIEVVSRKRSGMSWRRGRVSMLLRVFVPQEYDLDIKTSGGDIHTNSINGQVQLETSGGDIATENISGDDTHLRSSGGDIRFGSITSDEIKVMTSGGDISGEGLNGSDVTVQTSGGDISLSTLRGESVVGTSGGRIELLNIDGDVRASTSGGRINVGLANNAQRVSLSTSGGSITIEAPAGLSADVDFEGNKIDVDSSFKIDGEIKKRSARGSINGGGPTIRAKTSGGSIKLRTR